MAFETRLTAEMNARFRRSGHWRDETFYDVLVRCAATHPEREAVVDTRHRVTYGELVP